MYLVCLFFYFKQKTAYDMRISDWSSDVCSSDLFLCILRLGLILARLVRNIAAVVARRDGLAGRADRAVIHLDAVGPHIRSEERRVGKECVSTCRSRWSPYH